MSVRLWSRLKVIKTLRGIAGLKPMYLALSFLFNVILRARLEQRTGLVSCDSCNLILFPATIVRRTAVCFLNSGRGGVISTLFVSFHKAV
ncbi:hypothetical protein BD289DRAFT_433420 [Coniella lustricola]|uniref:Uncharacterized protein n=1 Tax=Coniella lustricola TaxID=2025994 RepID=A0A2T3A8S5_9PEZI|nr:hypothetical protein BD289DRAFT_433420 [Coniella lustricola]